MKETLIAVYERESTLWKNANGFYHAQDWTKMECKTFDYSEEIDSIRRDNFRWIEHRDEKEIDVTEREIERRYGKPYCITFINKRRTNSKSCWFKTKEEANQFVKSVLTDKILKNFKRIK